MKIAVTGASGQIGFTLCEELEKQGHTLIILVHNHSKWLNQLKAKKVKGSTTNPEDLLRLTEGVDVVFHLAAIVSINGDPGGMLESVNVGGTANMIEACRVNKVKRLVHFSSVHAYKSTPLDKPMTEDNELSDHTCFLYEQSKAKAQKLVQEAARRGDINAVIVNPTGVIGPNDWLPSIKGNMLMDFYNKKIPAITPGGFDWVDTRDVVDGAIAAMEKGRNGESYILSGKFYTVKALSSLIGEVTGKKTPQLIVPFWVLQLSLPFILVWSKVTKTEPLFTKESIGILMVANANVSYQKAAAELGYKPRPLSETLTDTYSWLKKNNYIS